MSEPSQEDLIEFLKEIFESACTCGYGSDKDIQAYEQIKQSIKLAYDEDWQKVKKDLGEFMKSQKLIVSKEFVQKWKRTFKAMDGCYTPSTILIEFVEAFLKEAGVKVE